MRATPLPAPFRDLAPNHPIVRCVKCGLLTFYDEICCFESEATVCMARQDFARRQIN